MSQLAIGALTWIFLLSALVSFAGARLEIENTDVVDQGEFPANDPPTAVFTLMNRGDSALKVQKLAASCDCLTLRLDRHEAAPGDKIKLYARLIPGTISGSYVKNIVIRSNAENPVAVMRLSGKAVPVVEVLPAARLLAGHIPLHQTWTETCHLQASVPGVKLGEPTAKSSIPATAELRQDDERNWRLTIAVTASEVGKTLRGEVVVPILEPKGWQPLCIQFAGRLGLELTAYPVQLFIPANPVVEFVREFEIILQGADKIAADKLIFPKIERTSFKLLKIEEGNRARIEMRREGVKSAGTFDCPVIFIEYPGASKAVIKLSPAGFLDR